jgi:hypothetical protein
MLQMEVVHPVGSWYQTKAPSKQQCEYSLLWGQTYIFSDPDYSAFAICGFSLRRK